MMVAGLQDGTFSGWNLETNQVDALQAHSAPITVLFKHEQFLVSGDAQGHIQVRELPSFNVVLEKPPVSPQGYQPAAITSICVMNQPSGPIVVSGDVSGKI